MKVVFEADFYLEEDFAGDYDTEAITPSTRGVAGDFDVVGSNDVLGQSSNSSYKVLDLE